MPPALKLLFWVIVILDVYVLVYYRLLVKHYYEQAQGISEGTFWTLLSFPPYGRLPQAGKRYARRYWVALTVLAGCVTALAMTADFSRFGF